MLGLATGRVLAACGPEERWDAFIGQQMRAPDACDAGMPRTAAAWRSALAAVRRSGTCLLHRPAGKTCAVGVAVRGPGGVVLAALCAVAAFRKRK